MTAFITAQPTVQDSYLRKCRARCGDVFERWLNTFELRYGTRSTDYPFSYAEIIVDNRGRGEGYFIPAAQIRFDNDDRLVEVVNFGIYPARLAAVRQRRSETLPRAGASAPRWQ